MDLDKITKTKKSTFESKIKPMLMYVGTIGSILMVIAYIIAVIVLVFGFKATLSMKQLLAFAIANAAVGMLVMFCLKIQGIDFAKNLPENILISKTYYGSETKDKPYRNMKYFWITSTSSDFVTKAISVIVSTCLLVKIVIAGNEDFALLGLAAVNIIMFICFGFISLVKAYDFYNEYQVPYMKNELKKAGIELKIEPKNDIIISEESGEQTNDSETIS